MAVQPRLPGEGRLPTVLSMSARILSGLLGASSVGAGTAAVFIKNNNGGSLALIAAGVLFLLMSLTGHGVRSFKIGSNEIIMDTFNEAIALKNAGDDEGAEELIDDLMAYPLASPLESRPHLPFYLHNAVDSLQYQAVARPLLYEQSASSALKDVIADKAVILPEIGSRRFDLLLQFDAGLAAAVEIRAGVQIRPEAFAASIRTRVSSVNEEIPLRALLLVVNAAPNSEVAEDLAARLAPLLPIRLLVWPWKPEYGVDRMRQGIDQLLTIAR